MGDHEKGIITADECKRHLSQLMTRKAFRKEIKKINDPFIIRILKTIFCIEPQTIRSADEDELNEYGL